jgi:hypothetical protein
MRVTPRVAVVAVLIAVAAVLAAWNLIVNDDSAVDWASVMQQREQSAISRQYLAAPKKPLVALVTMLGTEYHRERDARRMAHMACYASRRGLPYFIENTTLTHSFWDKQLAVLKHLYAPLGSDVGSDSSYEWIILVDGDTYVNPSADLEAWVAGLPADVHFAITEMQYTTKLYAGRMGLDAGVFAVRSSAIGRQFMIDWLAMSGRRWVNHDNAALYAAMLRWWTTPNKHAGGVVNSTINAGKPYNGAWDYLLYEYPGRDPQNYFGYYFRFYEMVFGEELNWIKKYDYKETIWENSVVRDVNSRPFLIMDWHEKHSFSSCVPEVEPMIYHNKDTEDHFVLDTECAASTGAALDGVKQWKMPSFRIRSPQLVHAENEKVSPPVFIHIPKTGGSSVEDALFKHGEF